MIQVVEHNMDLFEDPPSSQKKESKRTVSWRRNEADYGTSFSGGTSTADALIRSPQRVQNAAVAGQHLVAAGEVPTLTHVPDAVAKVTAENGVLLSEPGAMTVSRVITEAVERTGRIVGE